MGKIGKEMFCRLVYGGIATFCILSLPKFHLAKVAQSDLWVKSNKGCLQDPVGPFSQVAAKVIQTLHVFSTTCLAVVICVACVQYAPLFC